MHGAQPSCSDWSPFETQCTRHCYYSGIIKLDCMKWMTRFITLQNMYRGSWKCGAACVSSVSAQATILTPRFFYIHRNSIISRIESTSITHRRSNQSFVAAAQQQQWDATATDASHSRVARLAVFVSGGGSNFKAIHASILSGSIKGEVVAVVTNAPNCGGAEFARQHGIDVVVYPPASTSGGSLNINIDDESLAAVGTTSAKASIASTRVRDDSSLTSARSRYLSTSGLTEALKKVCYFSPCQHNQVIMNVNFRVN